MISPFCAISVQIYCELLKICCDISVCFHSWYINSSYDLYLLLFSSSTGILNVSHVADAHKKPIDDDNNNNDN